MKTIEPKRGRDRVILQGIVVLLATAALGGSAVNGGDLLPMRMLGAALVPAAVVALASRSNSRFPFGRALGLLLACVAAGLGTASSMTGLWLYLSSMVWLLLAGPPLVRKAADLLALFPLVGIDVADSESGHVASLDNLASRELARARRAGRPLSVVSLSLRQESPVTLTRQKQVAAAAADLMALLRQTDVFGYRGRNEFIFLLVETPGTEATGLLERLRSELDADLARRLQVGVASFPDDNPTWEGLKEIAKERERPLAASREDLVETAPTEVVA